MGENGERWNRALLCHRGYNGVSAALAAARSSTFR